MGGRYLAYGNHAVVKSLTNKSYIIVESNTNKKKRGGKIFKKFDDSLPFKSRL